MGIPPADQILAHHQDDGWIMRRFANIERTIQEHAAARRLENSSISAGEIGIKGGALRVYDDDGSVLAVLGDLSNGYRGTIINRAGGDPAFEIYGTGPGAMSGFVGLYDRSGNYVVTDDAFSARGLARPYIPIPMQDLSAPTATTTSSTFVDICGGVSAIQHPVMYAYLLVRSDDASTTGEVRLTLDSVQVGPTLTVTAGQFAAVPLGDPFAVTVNESVYGAIHTLSLQARRTAGTGTVGAKVLSLLGLESSFVP